MTEPVKLLVWGIPAEVVREIGLRLRGVVLSDALPTDDSIYIVRRAKDTSDDVRIAFCISMQQAETALHALKEVHVDRFFLSPVDMEEMLRELAKMGGVEVLPPQASHGEHIAAAVFAAWDPARAPTFQKIDKLSDTAIALLDAGLSPYLKAAAQRDAKSIAELAAQFGFEKGAQLARDLAERFSGQTLTPLDAAAISEQLLGLPESLVS